MNCRVLVMAFVVFLALNPLALNADEARRVTLGDEQEPTVELWLASSLTRVFPNTKPGSAKLELLAARNGTVSFQACMRNERVWSLLVNGAIEGSESLGSQVRLVDLVPMPHFTHNTPPEDLDGLDAIPGLVPDPLLPATEFRIGPHESRSYWITLKIPADAEPGKRELRFKFILGDHKHEFELPLTLDISPFVIQPRRDFHVIHWWRGEATWDYYKTGMFEDPRWWEITRGQLKNMLAHGSDVVYVPMFFDRREVFKRPCQLLVVEEPEPGKYKFDWTEVEQFTDMCKEIGFPKFEWSHLWIYWGVEHPIRIYKKDGNKFVMLWPEDEPAFSETYLNFLRQFLPSFHDFLVQEDLLEDSYFHLSDEPGEGQHVINYRAARKLLHELAPWMKVMDALSNIEYGRQGLTDIPVPLVDSAQAYIDAGIPHWVYYCCLPNGKWLNRFLDTPLPKIRMSGWLFYHLKAEGFLHWGYNYWHMMASENIGDPYKDSSNGDWPWIPYGDPFVVYPGKDGETLDSIRWEVFAESLQDYAILQTAGIKPDDSMFAELKSYADFPRSETWINDTIAKILKAPAKTNAVEQK